MLLGLVLAQVACWITMGSPSASTFAAVLLVLAVPILDTLLAIARRAILRAPIFTADHLHVHHVLRDGGLSPRKTLLVLYGLQVVLAGLGVATAAGYTIAAFVGVVVAAVAFASFLRAMVANRAAKAPAPQAAIPQPVARVASTPLSFQSSITAQLSERRTSVGR
jgi:UDP-GlcNAc:undecaprenyl-phosphate GlcNAc-1-phosphate transferase